MPTSPPIAASAPLSVDFPPWPAALTFWIVSMLVVMLCRRLAEHAATAVDSPSRRMSGARAGMVIGAIAWSLDVAGFFMYGDLQPHALELGNALAALLLMVASCRLTIPTLSLSVRKWQLAWACGGMALGVMLAHAALISSYVQDFTQIDLTAAAVASALSLTIVFFAALRLRSAKLNGHPASGVLGWFIDLVPCGAGLVGWHWMLCNMFPMKPLPPETQAGNDPVLLVSVLLFAAMLALDQLLAMRHDKGRQQLLRQGLQMLRASNAPLTPERDAQLALIADHLHELLLPQRLALHFQPIANLREGTLHLEALLRLHHPRLGPVNPELFFLVCDLHGITRRVDRLILRNAMDHVRHWQQACGQQVAISVNVAPITLLDPDFSGWLAAELARRGLPDHALKLELTEHAIIASGPGMTQAMDQLQSVGVHVVMDDFGVGYSSLGTLADLPIAGIKCDRLFLRRIAQDLRRQALLRHVAAMARELGVPVIVEGVETAEELCLVVGSGIDNIQGYLFARPVPACDVPAWLREQAPLRLQEMNALLAAGTPAASAASPSRLGVREEQLLVPHLVIGNRSLAGG